MRKIITILVALLILSPCVAQNKKTAARKKAKTTRTTKKKTVKSKKKTAEYTTPAIKNLRNERAGIQRKIKEQERKLRVNKADVKKRLSDLMVINSEIDQRQKSINDIQKDITHIDGNIDILKNQLSTLEQQLEERKAKYVKSMRYMAKNRSIQEKLMFIFSAKNLAQIYRRMRFVREYAAYQRTQGEMIKVKQDQITAKNNELKKVRGQKSTLLSKDKQEHAVLQGKQAEQKKMVNSLQKQQKTIQAIIDDQRKKDAELNAKIDQLVAEEAAKARARAIAEAKRKKAEAEAAAKRRAEELARKKAAAEAAARENAQRIAEAKAREERLKAEAKAAEKKNAEERERANQAAREAEADRIAAERKAKVEEQRHNKEVAEAKKEVNIAMDMDSSDRKLSGSFEANRGRLPMPVTGSYRIIGHYGQYNVEGLKNVRLSNSGITIQCSSGATVRSVFEGEVSAIMNYDGYKHVMIRHGAYITVYLNLGTANVYKGQHVSTRQAIGTIGKDDILSFQLHKVSNKVSTKLNPESWLGR